MPPKKRAAAKPKPKAAKKQKTNDGSPAISPDISEAENQKIHPSKSRVLNYSVTDAAEGEIKFISWNVNGLKALQKDINILQEIVKREKPAVIGLQEIKCADGAPELEVFATAVEGYTAHFNPCVTTNGYAGTAVYVDDKYKDSAVVTKDFPETLKGAKECNGEGRVTTVEFENFFYVNTYVPNAGQKLERLDYRTKTWDPCMFEYLKSLEKKGKSVVWTGDLNCAHHEIDIHNPKTNLKSAGFTPQERESFSTFVDNKKTGFIDVHRMLNPEAKVFTYWGYRFDARWKNMGWRLDYWITSKDVKDKVVGSHVLDKYFGSDHVPISIILKDE